MEVDISRRTSRFAAAGAGPEASPKGHYTHQSFSLWVV